MPGGSENQNELLDVASQFQVMNASDRRESPALPEVFSLVLIEESIMKVMRSVAALVLLLGTVGQGGQKPSSERLVGRWERSALEYYDTTMEERITYSLTQESDDQAEEWTWRFTQDGSRLRFEWRNAPQAIPVKPLRCAGEVRFPTSSVFNTKANHEMAVDLVFDDDQLGVNRVFRCLAKFDFQSNTPSRHRVHIIIPAESVSETTHNESAGEFAKRPTSMNQASNSRSRELILRRTSGTD